MCRILHICEANSPWTLIPESKRCPESLQSGIEWKNPQQTQKSAKLQNNIFCEFCKMGGYEVLHQHLHPARFGDDGKRCIYICTSKCFEKILLCIIKTDIILVSQHFGRTTISLTNSFDKKLRNITREWYMWGKEKTIRELDMLPTHRQVMVKYFIVVDKVHDVHEPLSHT